MTDISTALQHRWPGRKWVLRGNSLDGLEWLDSDARPTDADINQAIDDARTAALVAAVKAECRRRILQRFPDWKQSNMTARGVELQDQWRANGAWTEAEQADAAALRTAWSWIKAVRAASDAIEAMQPIPADFDADARWPA